MRWNKKPSVKSDKTEKIRTPKRGVVGYSRKSALLEEAITQMNAGKYGRSSAALKELLALDPMNMEARRLFATLHLRLGSLIPAREAFDSLITEAFQRQDYWLAESLLREYLAAGPRCVPYLEKLGTIYQEKGNALEAVEEYGKAIDILIEDPDPERPDYADQLYSKIRELAPASPVAFRLASFFDAATGELMFRGRSALETDRTQQPDVLEAESGDQVVPARPNGAMPWDVQVPSDMLASSGEILHPVEPSQSALQSGQGNNSEQHAQSSHTADVVERVAQEVGTAPTAEEISQFAVQDSVGDSQPSIGPIDARAAIAMVPVEAPLDVAPRDSPSLQMPEQVSLQAPEPSPMLEDRTVSGAMKLAAEEPADALVSNAEPSLPPSPPADGERPLFSLKTGSIRASNSEETSFQTGKVETVEVAERSSSDDSPIASAPVSADETAQPWKQPGFSWKSVFDTAWKFGEPSQAKDASTSPASTRLDETVADTLAAPPPQDRLVEGPAIPSPKQGAEHEKKDDEALRSRIAPMPWDQVQESVLSIPPVETNSSIEEPFEPSLDQPQGSGSTPQTRDSQEQASPSVGASDPEPDSFSLVQTNAPHAEPLQPSENLSQDSGSLPNARDTQAQSSPSVTDANPEPESFSLVRRNAPSAEPLQPSVDLSQNSDRLSYARDSQAQPSPSVSDGNPEPDSFSLVQDVPTVHAEERHDSTVEIGAPSTRIQGTEQEVVDSAPAFSIVGSSKADEAVSLASQEPEPQARPENSGLESAVDQEAVRKEPAELAIKQEQVQTSSAPEGDGLNFKAEFQMHHSPSLDEVIREKAETVQPFQSAPIEQGETEPIAIDLPVVSESREASQVFQDDNQAKEMVKVRIHPAISEPILPQQELMEDDGSRRTSLDHAAITSTPAEPASPDRQEASQPSPTAHIPDAAFVETSRIRRAPETSIRVEEAKQSQKSPSILSGVGTAITGFLRTCFSTTQAIVRTVVGLVVLVGLCVAIGIGALALTWMVMEEPPSPTFHSFTTTPQQTLSGAQKNAYTLLMGIDTPVGQDPVRAGIERSSAVGDGTTALGCFGTPGPETSDRLSASAGTMRGWVRGSDPLGQFKSNQGAIQEWGSRHQATLERYRQWKKLPFEDWGYGQPVSPPCGVMVFAHQLHVADGFAQGADVAVDRLETDMEMWRVVLSQARTLPVKMLALQAINDDIALASGMLVRSDFDTKYLGRITKFVRPLDQAELSLRWPMQSELVAAGKTYESQLKTARAEGQAMSVMVASALPLPKQRRLNDYATYYEASYQATGKKDYGSLPKWKDHMRVPATGVMDYLANPIENLVGVEPLPDWALYSGLVVDTDAHLRLASLQAWLRRGPAEGDLPNKIAKAGQDFYDPYTGLPMLVNQKKGLLYSVGHDGKDQDADLQADVAVEIPVTSTSAGQVKSSASSSKSR